MTRLLTLTAMLGLAALAATPALAKPQVGAPAPAFTGVDTSGKSVSLADFRGRTVVLEWTNHGCPYVAMHYDTGNMQAVQAKAAAAGAAWITIISSAPGKQGHVAPAEADAIAAEAGAVRSATLIDEAGEIGRMYDAKTTPEMFVIDAEGVVQYMGAIDDRPSANPNGLDEAKNYVVAALDAVASGNKVAEPVSTPYGCSVKY